MPSPIDTLSRHPAIPVTVAAVMTAAAIAGMAILAPAAGNAAFLPPGSELVRAQERLVEDFPDAAGISDVNVIGGSGGRPARPPRCASCR